MPGTRETPGGLPIFQESARTWRLLCRCRCKSNEPVTSTIPCLCPAVRGRALPAWAAWERTSANSAPSRHLSPRCEQEWSEVIPRFFSDCTIWGEAMVGAIRANGRNEVLRQCKLPKYYADCLIRHPSYYGMILRQFPRALRGAGQGVVAGTARFLARLLRRHVVRVKSLLVSTVGCETGRANLPRWRPGRHRGRRGRVFRVSRPEWFQFFQGGGSGGQPSCRRPTRRRGRRRNPERIGAIVLAGQVNREGKDGPNGPLKKGIGANLWASLPRKPMVVRCLSPFFNGLPI